MDAPVESVLACNCCRRRKLRCSRELPACSQCRRTGAECEYKGEKCKPGMRPGVIETIHRRLEGLEKSIEELKSAEPRNAPNPQEPNDIVRLARELHRLNESVHLVAGSPHKRRRTDEDVTTLVPQYPGTPSLPPEPILQAIIEAYFSHLHPWIPMLQQARFDQRLANPATRPKLLVILHAMVVAATRYVDPTCIPGPLPTPAERKQTRSWVISTAMSALVIENLQALTIIAFNDIGNGEAMRAWAIIGSLTRTAEYLQLTVEQDGQDGQGTPDRASLSRPFVSLPPSPEEPWIEREERRRVFWNIFSLDRFCSITTGWNTSLTSDDVCRRLPCDIGLWWQDEPVVTPYFNIWDKSAGRIGNPIAFLPSQYTNNDNTHHMNKGTSPAESSHSPNQHSPTINMTTVGAFAYSIETTESLSQIGTYFLQQRVDMRDQHELGSWLTRFKELDLRLIHWKMLLPQKWKADMARQDSRMDPNLTLAHVSHNTSIILLHQPIAFPAPSWAFAARLPSACSADTCSAAAVEVAAIARNYLKTLPARLPVANLLAFCLFIAARALLIHWQYYPSAALAPEFPSLVESLDKMSRLWRGYDESRLPSDLAGRYAQKLRDLQSRCVQEEHYCIDPSGYTAEVSDLEQPPVQNSVPDILQSVHSVPNGQIPALDSAYQTGTGDLNMISQMFLDPKFMDMDRIISFHDGMFNADDYEV